MLGALSSAACIPRRLNCASFWRVSIKVAILGEAGLLPRQGPSIQRADFGPKTRASEHSKEGLSISQ